MKTAYSFNEIFNGTPDETVPGLGRVMEVDLKSQPDIPAETAPPQEASLFSLCSEAAGLLGMLSSAVTGLYEDYTYRYNALKKNNNPESHERRTYFVPYEEGGNRLDLNRIGKGDPLLDKGEEQTGFYLDFLDSFDSFRNSLSVNDEKRMYTELVDKIAQIQQKLRSEYSKIQEMYKRGVLGSAVTTQKKRAVEYMRPLTDAQKLILQSELAQPFFFGKNAFTCIRPTDYVDPRLVPKTAVQALNDAQKKAIIDSRAKDVDWVALVK